MAPTGQISTDGYWMWNGTEWVPNPYGPAAAPPSAPYESAGFRAGVTTILVAATIPGLVLLTSVDLAIDFIPAPNDQQSLLIGLAALLAVVLWIGALIGAAVFFCMWLHRTVRNMPALGAPDPRWSPARAVVYCFIPIVSWFHPLWSVLDAWRGADASQRWLALPSRRRIPAPTLIVVWWASWLVGIFFGNIGSRMTGPSAAVLDVIGGVALAVAAVLCILVVRDVTARQERKNQLIVTGQLV
ncbi:MAG TPA: DUF4328 domain-containing protein [Candidatus Limnocylindrales bacterium]|nr:DUF4328 domain-containing protein [Candidatus Limnocylindrales bacterium]